MRPAVPGPLVVPILRAGLGLLDGVLAALPDAEVGVIGLKRDETTHRPLAYLERLPDDLRGRPSYIVDPMLATGRSLATAYEMLHARASGPITALCLIAAPEGVEHVHASARDIRIFTAALDLKLNERAFIVPGLGDAGDRLYGAGSA
jgi:uracil phosphoribosyltransferase